LGQFDVEQSSEVPVAPEPTGVGRVASASADRDEPGYRFVGLPPQQGGEREELLAEVQRLELELERYRAHAERTSKLFLSATNYAQWVRENARRDAELALRKARARVHRLEAAADALELTERELALRQEELARLQVLTDETRTQLSAFLAAGLEALSSESDPGQAGGAQPVLTDLQETLHGRLPAAGPQLGET
jgi:hypothetical protein